MSDGIVLTAAQRGLIDSMFGGKDVLVRRADRPGFAGVVHARAVNAESWEGGVLLLPDCSRDGGCLGISYETFMSLPERASA